MNTWLYAQGRYQTLLDVLPLECALQRRELFLQYLDALSGLGRFETVRDLLKSERFPLEPVQAVPYISDTIRSVQSQTLPANEIIVVDDCSRDETARIAESLDARVIRQVNNGVASARNVGIRAARK